MALDNVSPCPSMNNRTNRSLGYAKHFRELAPGITMPDKGPNFLNLLFGELCPGVRFSISPKTRRVVATLENHVSGIIALRAKEKMIRANTRRVIAFVKNGFSLWNFSKGQTPGIAVSSCVFAIHPKLSVSKFGFASNPFPALLGFVYFLPKGLRKLLPVSEMTASVAAIFNRVSRACARGSKKWFRAVCADYRNGSFAWHYSYDATHPY